MYLIFFLIWIIFNGQFTWEIAAFGAVISGAMYWFICRFMNYKPRMDVLLCKKFFLILQYIRFRTDLKTAPARILLANSITLTPGTITVSLEENEYVVHCLDKELAKGINNSLFVTLLKRLERMD